MDSELHRVALIPNKNYKRSGSKSYVSLLHKYGFNPTQAGPWFFSNVLQGRGKHGNLMKLGGKSQTQRVLQKQVANNQVGNVPAEDSQNDSEYLCQVTIGTPGQTFTLDFDSGSSDLWLWSTELPRSVNTQGHSVFNPAKSSTFRKSPGSTWKISYGDGSSASGDVGTDNINLGGFVVKTQAIELAKNLSSQFQQDVSDGLLGLAFGALNTVRPTRVKTPVENMIAQKDIPQNKELFTVYLGSYKDANDPDKGQSFYTFGYIDQQTLNGQTPVYTPVDSSHGFWQFQSTSAVVGSQTIPRTGNTAIADTGTTLALVDDKTCQAIYAAIPGAKYDNDQQGWIFPTNCTEAQLPVVSFAIGGQQFAVQKEDLGFADAGNGMSYGGIQSRGDLTFDILGDTFLKSIYAIFDLGNMRFGAVQRVDPTQKMGL